MNDFHVATHRGTEFAKNFLNSGKFASLLDGDAVRIQIIDSDQSSGPEEAVKAIESGLAKVKRGCYEFEFKDAGPGWELSDRNGSVRLTRVSQKDFRARRII